MGRRRRLHAAASPATARTSTARRPAGNSWRARYNNSGPTLNDHFAVEAICAKQPVGYTVAFSTADNPAHSQSAAVATCPTGTVLLSGGAPSTADTADVQQLSAFPLGPHRFKVVMWNGSNGDQRLTAFAMCAKQPPRYSITNSTSTDLGGPADDSGGVVCPTGSSIIGGGIHITNPRPLVTLGASFSDSGNQWVSEVVTDDPAPDHHHHLGHLRRVGRPATPGWPIGHPGAVSVPSVRHDLPAAATAAARASAAGRAPSNDGWTSQRIALAVAGMVAALVIGVLVGVLAAGDSNGGRADDGDHRRHRDDHPDADVAAQHRHQHRDRDRDGAAAQLVAGTVSRPRRGTPRPRPRAC